MMETLFLALIRFYEHNDPLIFLIPLVIATLVALIAKPNRRKVFFLIGILLLILQFEYTKVIFKEVKTDWINQLFSPEFRFHKYTLTTFLLQDIMPFLLSAAGWLLITLAAIL